jgi:transcriptional regulator with XRE-family HTH domain
MGHGGRKAMMVRFRTQRQTRLLSIRDLARIADVSPQTIQNIEAGKRMPRPSTMVKIAGALGVEPKEIDEFAEAIAKWTGDSGQ